jgi:transcriptional regulator
MGRETDRLQGTLDLLILKTLARLGETHGYAITRHIQSVSQDALRVEEGSLYPALHRMTDDGLIEAEWRMSENRRRARFYKLTEAGRRRLSEEEDKWARITAAVALVLNEG